MTSTLPGHPPRQRPRLATRLPGDPVRRDAMRSGTEAAAPVRRVRHEVRDGVAVVAFSAAASTGLALALLVLVRLAG